MAERVNDDIGTGSVGWLIFAWFDAAIYLISTASMGGMG